MFDDLIEKFGLFIIFLFVVCLIILGVLSPLAIIWAINALFPTAGIPYTFWTWLAVIIVGGLFSPTVKIYRK